MGGWYYLLRDLEERKEETVGRESLSAMLGCGMEPSEQSLRLPTWDSGEGSRLEIYAWGSSE